MLKEDGHKAFASVSAKRVLTTTKRQLQKESNHLEKYANFPEILSAGISRELPFFVLPLCILFRSEVNVVWLITSPCYSCVSVSAYEKVFRSSFDHFTFVFVSASAYE